VTVIALGGPRFEPLTSGARIYTGDALMPQVRLRYEGGLAPHAEVTLQLEAPNATIGQLVADTGLAKPTTEDDPASGFHATLKKLGGGKPYRLATRRDRADLIDDGAHYDGAMERDGIYGNLLTELTRFEGTYRFHARARIEEPCLAQRETEWAIHVELGIDPAKTNLAVTGMKTGQRHRSGTLTIRPCDCYGNPLGPGRGEQIPVSGGPATEAGPLMDNGDGTYSVSASWDPGVSDWPVLIISQPERNPIVLSIAGGGVERFSRWLWRLMSLLALLRGWLSRQARRQRRRSS
jgi:hypothetical protein